VHPWRRNIELMAVYSIEKFRREPGFSWVFDDLTPVLEVLASASHPENLIRLPPNAKQAVAAFLQSVIRFQPAQRVTEGIVGIGHAEAVAAFEGC
jgi:hypothetical protein